VVILETFSMRRLVSRESLGSSRSKQKRKLGAHEIVSLNSVISGEKIVDN